MTDHTDILLIVDQKWRDLPGMVALAVWLERRHSISTTLIPYGVWRERLVRHRPHVVVLTHMNGSRNRAIVETARRLGTRIVVIQTEGRPNNTELLEYIVGRPEDLTAVDLWFTWSDTVRSYIIERGLLPADRVVTAGAHRFDVYRAPLNGLLASRQEFAQSHGLDPRQPIVSLATNFTCTKYYRHNADFLRNDWKDLGLARLPSYSDPDDFARRDYEARETTLDFMRELLRVRPAIQLMLKPHPTEEHGRYEEFLDECRKEFGPRVAFIGTEYIWNVLNSADVHLHRMCTTGVEAWFLDVPSIDVHAKDYYGWSLKLPGAAADAVAGNDLVTNASDLIARVDYYLAGGKPTKDQLAARDAYIQKWLHRVDGRRCEEHADRLAALVLPRPSRHRAPIREHLRVMARRAKQAFESDIWNTAARSGLNRSPADHLGQVDCRIAPDDVTLWRQRVRGLFAPEICGNVQDAVITGVKI